MQDDIALFVANAFLQVLTNKANVSVLKPNAVTVGQIERTQELVDAGVLPQGDLLEIEAVDATEKQNIVTAENGVTLSLINLAQLLQIRDYDDFDIVDQGYEILGTEILEKGLRTRCCSPGLSQRGFDCRDQCGFGRKDLQIARSAYMPTLGAYLNYNTRESDRFVG